MTTPTIAKPALLSTAALALVAIALAGCSNPGGAADLGDDETGMIATDLPWSWTDEGKVIRSQAHFGVPFDATLPSALGGTVRIVSGPPVDIALMTADAFATFEKDRTVTAAGACTGTAATEFSFGSPGCTLDPGSYVLVLRNTNPHSPDDAATATSGPATVAVAVNVQPVA